MPDALGPACLSAIVVSVKVKPKTIALPAVAILVLAGLCAWFWSYRKSMPFNRHGVAHQLPYKWDSYVRPDLRFTMEPMSNVIAKVNAVIRNVSSNAVPEAVKLDTTPTQAVKVGSHPSLDPYMDQLITEFRENEMEMNRRGAEGFENTPFTGSLDGHHSLWCTLAGPGNGGLQWEAKADALHVSRMPRVMECRAYRVTDGLVQGMRQQRSKGEYKVDAEPLVSALIYETDIHSWSIMLPEGPNAWSSEYRYDKVFKYVPSLNVILALTTPEEHASAEKRLKASGLWMDIQTDRNGHNPQGAANGRQPLSSETNQTSAAAASRRSP